MSKLKNLYRTVLMTFLLVTTLMIAGCDGNVGVGVSVGIPIGDHGHLSVGSGRYWY